MSQPGQLSHGIPPRDTTKELARRVADLAALVQQTQAGLGQAIQQTSAGINSSWTSYTPTWTGTSGNPNIALGGHQVFAGYTRFGANGKTLAGAIKVVLGGSNYGSGVYYFGLPFAAASGFLGSFQISGVVFDLSSTLKMSRGGFLQSGTEMVLTSESGAQVGPGTPVTFAAGDVLIVNFFGQLA